MKKSFKEQLTFKGILSDIDGTLYFKGAPVKGAVKAVEKLREKAIKLLFLTNTDSKSPKTIFNTLKDFGFKIYIEEIFTPIIALKEFLRIVPNKKLFLVTTEEIKREFQEFPKAESSDIPDYVIISDFRDNWDVDRLNQAFKYVKKGATLLGTQGNRYFLDHNAEPVIDTGSFVKMIADAANVTPHIFGKPSKEYFIQALKRINLKPEESIVIGDDIESDIQGAINAGLKAILVKTGKGEFYDPSELKFKPELIIKTFASILEYI